MSSDQFQITFTNNQYQVTRHHNGTSHSMTTKSMSKCTWKEMGRTLIIYLPLSPHPNDMDLRHVIFSDWLFTLSFTSTSTLRGKNLDVLQGWLILITHINPPQLEVIDRESKVLNYSKYVRPYIFINNRDRFHFRSPKMTRTRRSIGFTRLQIPVHLYYWGISSIEVIIFTPIPKELPQPT